MGGGSQNHASLVLSVVGIYACYVTYGILQEALYSRRPDGTRFSATSFVLSWQCLVNLLVSLIGSIIQHHLNKEDRKGSDAGKGKAPSTLVGIFTSRAVFLASLVYVLAMFASNEALSYVSYPTQALVKSCKMIPVMFGSIFIGKKRYTFLKYFSVALMTTGIVAFQFSGERLHSASFASMRTEDGRWGAAVGMTLLFLSLGLDGATGPLQESLRQHVSLNNMEQMLVNNAWGFLLMFSFSVVSGQLWPTVSDDSSRHMFPMIHFTAYVSPFVQIQYLAGHPAVARDLLLFGLCSACGQIFVFRTIREFSALTLTTITTTRKIFTILTSVLVYRHRLNSGQWWGMVVVVAGLLLETLPSAPAKWS
jgi:solute carrier family 35 (UDP-galactose transporter), member B1